MFGRKELNSEIEHLKYRLDTMNDAYWNLWSDHLGLKMVDVTEKRKIVNVEESKGLGAA